MPTYLYACECGHTESMFLPMSRAKWRPPCPNCDRTMRRDFSAERPAVISDPEATTHDVAKQCEDMRDGRRVSTRLLSRTLAQVPGVRKTVGPDGKKYAFFTSKQDRRQTLKRLGINSD